jgi:dinuclear metal center YbgI/SA1388 family protein
VIQLSELIEELESIWPQSHADDWDSVGLQVGSNAEQIKKVLVAVDLTDDVIEEAIAVKANLIVTHHPLLLKPVESVTDEKLKGSLITKLIKNSISLFTAHTNADVQSDGASSLMAAAFGLKDLKPLIPTDGGFGHGCVGILPEAITLEDFAKLVSSNLPGTARKVAFAGKADRLVKCVAICSGAGDSFLPVVLASKADVYVTSDLRHHPALDAISTPRAQGPLALVDVAHWAAESLWVPGAVAKLAQIKGVEPVASTTKTDPWTLEVN